jgi:glycosyltransferase involved in cell wall biosynthesis
MGDTGNTRADDVLVVVIGRNEGPRLGACLTAALAQRGPVVYIDSGSRDGSVEIARDLGVEVIELAEEQGYTAARARNRGLRVASDRSFGLVQFVDADCFLQPGWLDAGREALLRDDGLAVVVGHLRERHPEATVWNRLCDLEWRGPLGEISACGGNMLARVGPLARLGGFREDLIAGEEPELCLRLRRAGHRIQRLDLPMATHDAAMTRASQWWKRTVRSGFVLAEGVALHGKDKERYKVRDLAGVLLWAVLAPAFIAVATVLWFPVGAVSIGVYPAQFARLWMRECRGLGLGFGALRAASLVVCKFAQLQGVLTFLASRASGGRARLIEYKRAERAGKGALSR